MKIIGRLFEQQELTRIYDSDEAEFVAVYGRRRVGKTYLIREFFESKPGIFFRTSGIQNAALGDQLNTFRAEIERTFYQNRSSQLAPLGNWLAAMGALHDAIELMAHDKRVVIFLDELPWLATPKSGLLEAIDYYWNRFWSANPNIKLIVCGSAASWIIENILDNKGGLHNRITLRLPLQPFTLAESREYLHHLGVRYNQKQVLSLYLCLGGIPYYLRGASKGLSAIQNVDKLCFKRQGTLFDEFNRLFASLFTNHEDFEAIIREIAQHRMGMARGDLEKALNYKGGRLTKRLTALEEAGFIQSFLPWHKQRGVYYKLVDEYALFYLHWVHPIQLKKRRLSLSEARWANLSQTPAWQAWSGYAFEAIMLKHVDKICDALNIPPGSDVYPWRHVRSTKYPYPGAQIDLVIDRPDGAVNLCEIKYTTSPYVLDAQTAEKMVARAETFQAIMGERQVFQTIISANGFRHNRYSKNFIDQSLSLSSFF